MRDSRRNVKSNGPASGSSRVAATANAKAEAECPEGTTRSAACGEVAGAARRRDERDKRRLPAKLDDLKAKLRKADRVAE